MKNDHFFAEMQKDACNPNGKNLLEKFLIRCINYNPHYSLSNNARIIADSPNNTIVKSKEDWERDGAVLNFTACSIPILAPKDKGIGGFVEVPAFDISQTNFYKPQPIVAISEETQLALLTTFCKKAGLQIVIREFKITSAYNIFYKDRVFYLRKGLPTKLHVSLLIKALIQWQLMAKENIPMQTSAYIADISSFMVMQWLGTEDKTIPYEIKKGFYSQKESYKNLNKAFFWAKRLRKTLKEILIA